MGRPRDPALDGAILDAAQALLEEAGCSGFTMEGVASRAGTGKQTLYRRWPSRGELLIDLYYRDPMPPPPLDGPLAAALDGFLELNLQRLYHPWHQNLLRSLAVAAQEDAALKAVMLARITRPRLELGRAIFRRAEAAGEVPAGLDAEPILEGAIGAIWFRLLFTEEPVTPALKPRLLRAMLAQARGPAPGKGTG
ncbi:TetR/AcrR family transcriptional regulator [Roseomonas sp. USHLN139]|uniref:TetR/AcrR family transcriptional regulator n=1 Tax=Roseomonas sp. USHLN139 TaxID=3081298 RepID=UPI003B015230